MGCDVYVHAEIKIKNQWEYYNQFEIKRNYALFQKIAGVRAEDKGIEPLSLPKGKLDNFSFMTAFHLHQMEADAHSITWLNHEEIVNLFAFIKCNISFSEWFARDNFGYLFGNSWDQFHLFPSDYPPEIQDFRFICWFNG